MLPWLILTLLVVGGFTMSILITIANRVASILTGLKALLGRLNETHSETLARLDLIDARLAYVASLLEVPALPVPGPLTYSLLREDDSMLVYQATLPALPDPLGDVSKQRLVVTADGASVLDAELDLTAVTSPEFSVADNAAVNLSLTYIDDAGNASAPSEQAFTAMDTIPPNAPGAFGEITLVREE